MTLSASRASGAGLGLALSRATPRLGYATPVASDTRTGSY